jgi:hypothetical protein
MPEKLSRGIQVNKGGTGRTPTNYFHPMPRRLAFALALTVLGCHGPLGQATPEPSAHALSGLAAQHIVVLPTYAVNVAPGLSWASQIGRAADVVRTLDAEILAALDDRGLRSTWIFPEQLERSFRQNPTYASDPYHLAEEPLRSPSLAVDARLPEPLASQVRTIVALHEDARLVLAPVELRLEPVGAGGRGVLRLVLLDARASNVRWMGEIVSDTASSFGPSITASIGARLANVVAP